jgi:hypothetical protein
MKAGRTLVGSILALALLGAPPAAAERTITMKAGPFDLGPFQTLKPKVIVKSPKVDGYITWMHSRLVDEHGEEVLIQRVMLHQHIAIYPLHALCSTNEEFRGLVTETWRP